MKSETFYCLLMDASSSMSDVRQESLKVINDQIGHCRKLMKENENQSMRISLYLFNTDVEKVYVNRNPNKAKLLKPSEYVPDGCTALLDAIGLCISDIENIIKPKDDVIMLIVTDGMENASQFYTFSQISQKIKKLKATEKWTFSFAGADIDSWDLAGRLSISADEVVSFKKVDLNENLSRLLSGMSDYMVSKAAGDMKPVFFRRIKD
jgi:hypothetical protein